MQTLLTLVPVAQDSSEEGFGLQAGPYAFFFFVAMGLALVFLLFSLRKHTGRVTFNDAGMTDAERMSRMDDLGSDDAGSGPARHG